MRKDITIAKVPWGVRDVLRLLILTFLIPTLFFISMIVLSRFGILPESFREAIKNEDTLVTSILSGVTVLTEVGLIIWLLKKYRLKLSDIGIRKFSVLKAIGYIVGGIVVFLILVSIAFVLVVMIAPSIDPNQSQEVGFEFGKIGWGLWVSFAFTVIVIPIIEELYFRGIIFPAVTKRFGWIIGIAGSSMVFAVLHGQYNVMIYTFILGCVLCVMYIRLKSIVPGIIFHIINNAVAFSLIAGLIK
ncbi:MAG TPA: CPBP family intramembrane metalloprotease [Candidatus Saccharibacteria bacterium]|nr:CPBP family intramembrane metalloprotease [Candidatus Saccharibacteria bacterium]HMT39348.1 CPBP family intramembrane metalloprotease [Candidatus Saccharibacteria bacterium]